MSEAFQKFLPPPTPLSQPYWDACNRQQLLIQQCSACGHHQFYPRSFCTECGQGKPRWVRARGRGTVVTWTIVRRPVSEAYAADTPYVIALIRLAEGPVMMSQVTGCDPEQVTSGMSVDVVFESWADGVMVPNFKPAKADA